MFDRGHKFDSLSSAASLRVQRRSPTRAEKTHHHHHHLSRYEPYPPPIISKPLASSSAIKSNMTSAESLELLRSYMHETRWQWSASGVNVMSYIPTVGYAMSDRTLIDWNKIHAECGYYTHSGRHVVSPSTINEWLVALAVGEWRHPGGIFTVPLQLLMDAHACVLTDKERIDDKILNVQGLTPFHGNPIAQIGAPEDSKHTLESYVKFLTKELQHHKRFVVFSADVSRISLRFKNVALFEKNPF